MTFVKHWIYARLGITSEFIRSSQKGAMNAKTEEEEEDGDDEEQ